MSDEPIDRRSFMSKIGSTAAVGTGGVALGTNNARAMTYIGYDELYGLSIEDLCAVGPVGLGTYAMASAADPVPGNELFLGVTAGAAGTGCAIYNRFVDEHPDTEHVLIARADESYGNVDEGDIIVSPDDGSDRPWWMPWVLL